MRTHKCSVVSCNCGVAAREDNDVIVVDFCTGAVQTARFASKGIPANGTKFMRDNTGKNFIVSCTIYFSIAFVEQHYLFNVLSSKSAMSLFTCHYHYCPLYSFRTGSF